MKWKCEQYGRRQDPDFHICRVKNSILRLDLRSTIFISAMALSPDLAQELTKVGLARHTGTVETMTRF